MRKGKKHTNEYSQRKVTIPKFLYKYVPISNWEYFFSAWTIRFTPPLEFNDPFDSIPSITVRAGEQYTNIDENKNTLEYKRIIEESYSKNNYEEQGISKSEYIKFIGDNFCELVNSLEADISPIKRDAILGGIQYFVNNHGILSLTTNCKNLLMWAHYANSHNGFVIKFKHDKTFLDGITFPVTYKMKRPKISLENLVCGEHSAFLIKSSEWKYEKEYRSIVRYADNTIGQWRHEIQKGVIELPKESVCGIIFGVNVADSDIKEKGVPLRNNPDCKHITLQQAYLDPNKYSLNFKDIF